METWWKEKAILLHKEARSSVWGSTAHHCARIRACSKHLQNSLPPSTHISASISSQSGDIWCCVSQGSLEATCTTQNPQTMTSIFRIKLVYCYNTAKPRASFLRPVHNNWILKGLEFSRSDVIWSRDLTCFLISGLYWDWGAYIESCSLCKKGSFLLKRTGTNDFHILAEEKMHFIKI